MYTHIVNIVDKWGPARMSYLRYVRLYIQLSYNMFTRLFQQSKKHFFAYKMS